MIVPYCYGSCELRSGIEYCNNSYCASDTVSGEVLPRHIGRRKEEKFPVLQISWNDSQLNQLCGSRLINY